MTADHHSPAGLAAAVRERSQAPPEDLPERWIEPEDEGSYALGKLAGQTFAAEYATRSDLAQAWRLVVSGGTADMLPLGRSVAAWVEQEVRRGDRVDLLPGRYEARSPWTDGLIDAAAEAWLAIRDDV